MEILEDREEWYAEYRDVWLAHFEETGETDWKIYNRPRNSEAPAGPGVELSKSRLIFITTAGGYLRDEQKPYDAENPLGDYTIRTFPSSTPLDAIVYAHTHYDHRFLDEDPQVLMPLRHLEDMVAEGIIGELATNVINFMGYEPDVTRVLDELIPKAVRLTKQEAPDAALLVPA